MKIALFGANGGIGRRILEEATRRGHQVTAIVRDPAKLEDKAEGVTVTQGHILDHASVAKTVTGHDAVISAIGPSGLENPQIVVETARSLLAALPQTGVRRLLVVGGAGSLEVAPGVELLDAPEFPAEWKPIAIAHRDALDLYRANTELDWTYLSPAIMIQPGERTGHYRTGLDQVVFDDKGQSQISNEDYAIALIDELEKGQFIRRRFTVAY